MDKVYLVLGANGFIGSHIVDVLAKQDAVTVRAFDRFNEEPQFKQADNIAVIKGNIFDDNDLRSAMVGVNYVIHCFSATTPFTSDNNPYMDITDNLLNSVQLFDLCADEGVEKIGFISSGGAVYGRLSEEKIATELDAPLPVSPYGITKLSIEHYLEYFKRKRGMDYVAYRLTNPFGPRQVMKKNQGVIPTFLQRIQNNEEIVVYGDGTSTRDYIYIEDAAAMIVNSFIQDCKHGVYNIGMGRQTSLNDIIGELRTLTKKDFKVVYNDAPATFLHSTGISMERYFGEFGEVEFTNLHDGLAKLIKHQQQKRA